MFAKQKVREKLKISFWELLEYLYAFKSDLFKCKIVN